MIKFMRMQSLKVFSYKFCCPSDDIMRCKIKTGAKLLRWALICKERCPENLRLQLVMKVPL